MCQITDNTRNIQNGQLNFEGNTTACHRCVDGVAYVHTKRCVTCKGKGKVMKSVRNVRCKDCKGNGYTHLETPLATGTCEKCNGTTRIPANMFDNMTKADKEWAFENLFNFEKPYVSRTSGFNEQYLGIGVMAGVTDYGRYKSMTPCEFKDEVRKNFVTGFMQYVSFVKDKKQLPKEILIVKKESGWFAYGVY